MPRDNAARMLSLRKTTLAVMWLGLLLSGCDNPAKNNSESRASATVSTTTSAAPAFDIEGFCEKIMALPAGRECAGDDEIREGNKVGYCTTVLRKAREDGRVTFDRQAAASCASAVKTVTLPDRRTLRDVARALPGCRAVVKGRQAQGAACDRSMECQAALICVEQHCQPAATAKQPCKPLTDDGLSLVRSNCGADLLCSEQRCVAVEAAAAKQNGESCAREECAAGLFCNETARATQRAQRGSKRCSPKKKAGSTCGHSRECLGRCSRQEGRKCVAYCGSG